eukprot:2266727-Pleurochrysis_carterae.AAC.2
MYTCGRECTGYMDILRLCLLRNEHALARSRVELDLPLSPRASTQSSVAAAILGSRVEREQSEWKAARCAQTRYAMCGSAVTPCRAALYMRSFTNSTSLCAVSPDGQARVQAMHGISLWL